MGKKLQAFQPISLLHSTFHKCHGDHCDYGDDKEYDDDVYDDDDIGFGRPPKTDRTAIGQSREGEDDRLLDHNTSSPASPILTLLIKVSL